MIHGRNLPDYFHLRAFLNLIKEGRVSPAAEELRTSQANLRRMVSSLESWAGASLYQVEKSGRFRPSDLGAVLMREAPTVMEACRSFQKQLAEIHRRGRLLRIGVQEGLFRSRMMGRAMATLRRDGRFRPSPVSLPVGSGVPVLESGEADLLISVEGSMSRRTVCYDLPPFPVLVLVAPGAEGMPESWKDLAAGGVALSPALSLDCETEVAAACRKAGGKAGVRLDASGLAHWREGGGETPYCLVLEDEVNLDRFEGSVVPCPEGLQSVIRVTHLSNHPYPFLEEVARHMVEKFHQPVEAHGL